MKLVKLSLVGPLVLGFLLVGILSACKTEHKESKATTVEKTNYEIWSDTIVKVKYSDGSIAKVWGYRPNDSIMHYEWQYYHNGRLWIEGPAYGKLRHGKWRAYDEKGDLLSMGSYKMGKGEGIKTVWYPSGQKMYEGKIHDGERVGVWEFFDKEGNKVKEINYSQLRANKLLNKRIAN